MVRYVRVLKIEKRYEPARGALLIKTMIDTNNFYSSLNLRAAAYLGSGCDSRRNVSEKEKYEADGANRATHLWFDSFRQFSTLTRDSVKLQIKVQSTRVTK